MLKNKKIQNTNENFWCAYANLKMDFSDFAGDSKLLAFYRLKSVCIYKNGFTLKMAAFFPRSPTPAIH
jgi:hypothetical protein